MNVLREKLSKNMQKIAQSEVVLVLNNMYVGACLLFEADMSAIQPVCWLLIYVDNGIIEENRARAVKQVLELEMAASSSLVTHISTVWTRLLHKFLTAGGIMSVIWPAAHTSDISPVFM